MPILIDKKDFALGNYQFQFQGDQVYWTNRIEEEEELALVRLFGDVLFNKLKTNPLDTDFDPIRGIISNGSGDSKGLKYTILGFVYCGLIVTDGVYSANAMGHIQSEVTERISLTNNYTVAWNTSVDNAIVIRQELINGVVGLEDYKFPYEYSKSFRIW